MLIVSKFKDYYDPIAHQYKDNSMVYKRQCQSIKCQSIINSKSKAINKSSISSIERLKNIFSSLEQGRIIPQSSSKIFSILPPESPKIYSGLIGFCGKIYPIYKHFLGFDFDVDVMRDRFIENGLKSEMEKFERKNNYYYLCVFNWNKAKSKQKELKGMDIGVDLFLQLNTPCFLLMPKNSIFGWLKRYQVFGENNENIICNEDNIIIDPRLEGLEFFKEIDCYTAFQEIRMFLSNTLLNHNNINKETTTMKDDLILLQSHGFDEKSFKSGKPGNKKYNRKLNKLKKNKKPN